jgi:hypothetical protein
MMVRWKGYKNEAYHITLYRHNTGGNRRKKKPFRFFFEILFRRPLMSCCCYYITDKTCVSTFFVCVGLGWGYWCPSLGKGRRLTLKKISPLFYSHRRRHMYRLVVAVLYNNNDKIPICCRGSSAHLKGSLRIGGRSRVEEWEENQIGLHVKDLVTLFIRRWRIL